MLELIIGMGITLSIVGIAATLLSSSFNVRSRENKRTEAIAAAQHALSNISRDVANAGFGLRKNGIVADDSDASSIRIRANLDAFSGTSNAASLAQADEDVEYFLHKSDPDPNAVCGNLVRCDLMRYDVNLQQSRLLVGNVDDFEIYYFSQRVDYTLDPTGGINVTTSGVSEVDDQSQTNYLVITMLLNLDAVGTPGQPGYIPASQVQLATDVAIRNRNLAFY